MKKLSVLIISLVLASCASAPIANHYSAKSLGTGGIEVQGGALAIGTAMPFFKAGVGVASDLDVGVQFETINIGGYAKYSLLNPKGDGLALAIVGAGGKSGDTG